MKLRLLSICLPGLLCVLAGDAQPFTATYDFANVTITSGRTDPSPVPAAAGASFGSFKATGSGLSSNPNAGGRFSFTGWPLGATNGSNVLTGYLDTGRYYEVIITPQAYYTLDISSITFTAQRSATGVRQWAVRSSLDGFAANLPASLEPANNTLLLADSNKFQIADRATTTAQDGCRIMLTGYSGLSTAVSFRVYGFNAESSGTWSIDNFRVNGSTTISPNAPNITVNAAAVAFPATAFNTTSAPQSYSIQAVNLSAPVVITTAAPFSLSETANGTYSTSLTIPAANVTGSKTIYVKFAPTAIGSFADTISHNSTSATVKKLPVSGQAIDPNNLSFNFNTCVNNGVPGSGFTPYSVTGAQLWTCTSFGRNGTNAVNINGYSGAPLNNEDWLISPPLSIAALDLPILRFWSRGEFTGPSLQLLVSTNYNGSGDPNAATWTDLQASFPPLTNTWTLTDGINLLPYKSFPNVFIAFKYTSSDELGAARWTLDDVDITNRTNLLSTTTELLGFDETSVANFSAGSKFKVQAIGYGDVTITAPANFQLSTDSLTYTTVITLPQATAQAGSFVFARFAPALKSLKLQGTLRFSGTGLDSLRIVLSGSSYPKAETFDAGCYNLSFFGSNATNNPTPEKIATQINNIATVFKRLNLDITGIEEVSSDIALDSLVKRLPHHKAVLSTRWSYSFAPPDPNFPPQKTGFLYDSTTVTLIEARDMFGRRYDSARAGHPDSLPNYPGGTPSSFWASGRLPFMATFDVTINASTTRVRVIDIHAKSASDVASYNRRVYDVKVLKDSLDAYYSNDIVIIVGDYNDRLAGSIYAGSTVSPYKPFVDDNARYAPLTYPLDVAGRVSFISGTGLIDHIITSDELNPYYISNSTDIEDPRTYIASYNATTASDHLPVYARFNFNVPLPVSLLRFTAVPKGTQVQVNWSTASEKDNSHFVIERSADGRVFAPLATVAGAGNSSSVSAYQVLDANPSNGANYYRLKQVDRDGTFSLSATVLIWFNAVKKMELQVYPNPVTNTITINTGSTATDFSAAIVGADGRLRLQAKGNVAAINQQLNSRLQVLPPGVYLLRVGNATEKYVVKFVKK